MPSRPLSTRRRLATPAGWVLLGLALTACAGHDPAAGPAAPTTGAVAAPTTTGPDEPTQAPTQAPTDASTDAFCAIVGLVEEHTPGEVARAWADVGTPADIGADARRGFQTYVRRHGGPPASELERRDLVALASYVVATCGAFPAGP